LLGPSHALYLPGCALSKHAAYATPLGNLTLDRATIDELKATGKFDTMSTDADETEHSMEMHIPYIYKILSQTFKDPSDYPPLIPILVGGTSASAEKSYGQLLAPYLGDPTSVFVVSSDFCHWGQRFQYTYYLPAAPSGQEGYSLRRRDKTPTEPPIYESISRLDSMAMDAIETGKHDAFLGNLKETGNTVCGRHPIGIVMAALEVLQQQGKISGEGSGRFKFVRYERSSDVEEAEDSSVSYASAVAVL
jgi:AmmeMemoRadiSam system protein B